MTTIHAHDIPLDPIERELMHDAQALVLNSVERKLRRAQDDHEADVACDDSMRGRLTTIEGIRNFIEAGNAYLTIVSKKTGTRFTLRFSRPKPEPGRARPIWVAVLSGSDNTSNYAFLGTIWTTRDALAHLYYKHSNRAHANSDAPSVKAAGWLLRVLNSRDEQALALCEVWHEGRCGRCGRKLTVPSSIESGFGPECINHV